MRTRERTAGASSLDPGWSRPPKPRHARAEGQARGSASAYPAAEPWRGSFVHTGEWSPTLPDAEERALIARLRSGEAAALATLHERLGGVMSTLAASMLRDRTEAEDQMQNHQRREPLVSKLHVPHVSHWHWSSPVMSASASLRINSAA